MPLGAQVYPQEVLSGDDCEAFLFRHPGREPVPVQGEKLGCQSVQLRLQTPSCHDVGHPDRSCCCVSVSEVHG